MVCHGETVFPQNLGIEWGGDGVTDQSNKSGTGTRHSGAGVNSDGVSLLGPLACAALRFLACSHLLSCLASSYSPSVPAVCARHLQGVRQGLPLMRCGLVCRRGTRVTGTTHWAMQTEHPRPTAEARRETCSE